MFFLLAHQHLFVRRPPHRKQKYTAVKVLRRKSRFLWQRAYWKKADAQVAESIHKLSRATSAMAEAIDESVDVMKRAIKRSSDAAEELVDDTTQRIKRHPVEATAVTFILGVIVGGFISWMISRR